MQVAQVDKQSQQQQKKQVKQFNKWLEKERLGGDKNGYYAKYAAASGKGSNVMKEALYEEFLLKSDQLLTVEDAARKVSQDRRQDVQREVGFKEGWVSEATLASAEWRNSKADAAIIFHSPHYTFENGLRRPSADPDLARHGHTEILYKMMKPATWTGTATMSQASNVQLDGVSKDQIKEYSEQFKDLFNSRVINKRPLAAIADEASSAADGDVDAGNESLVNPPKKPASAYVLFCKESERQEGETYVQYQRRTGDQWKKLSAADKLPWHQKREDLMARWTEQMRQFREDKKMQAPATPVATPALAAAPPQADADVFD